ncbi:hypothetical protein [Streptomyces sp. AC558_RSS880]|uniref:hypothetical protein n=1 Tax=Streptomyces sp. AC558_RSS880 TaxID=2823687 RepID=UPI001C220DE1|nr:hypothetical protein [Streptomyces sp. AC558_RSS880]
MPTEKQLMIDNNGKAGEFMGTVGGRWLFRPIGGGREWEVEKGAARPVTPEEARRLRPRPAEDEPEYDFGEAFSVDH